MEQKNRFSAKYGGNLRSHWQWSVILAFSLIILDIILLCEDLRSGLIAVLFSAVYFLAILGVYFYYRPRILRELVSFATHYGQVQRQILQEFEIPAALLEPDGRILWMNHEMCTLTEKHPNYKKGIATLFSEVRSEALPAEGEVQDIAVSYKEREYRAHIQRIAMDELLEEAGMVEKDSEINYLYMLYLFDETQLRRYIRENEDMRPVVGLVHLDNFEEVMERTDEVHQSLLNVLVERKINKYFTSMNGLVKKLEKDRYLIVLNHKSLEALKEDRFSLLSEVKTISIGNDMSMTLSGGFGSEGSGYLQNYEYARGAIELALGRGGDQVVVRRGDEMTFFGGKTRQAERSTRVRARVKAQALRELMLAADQVVAMGHGMTDLDSFGAAVGICRAAMTVGKPAHIVLGEINTNIRDWVKKFKESRDYPEDFFITHEEAIDLVTDTTAVVVVDTNKPSMTECQEILTKSHCVVVLDHHRRGTETIENASLSYIEPSASSACEMVAEILQYFNESVRLKTLEADAIYAGIIIDTSSFSTKAGVRTFEAAAYLRRCGADVIRVRKALRDDADSYMAKVEAVRGAQTFMNDFAISVLNGEGLENPSVVGAQAANELLNIVGLKASFVLTQYGGRIFISARSIDEVNVQLVCERLGGGGHLNVAGAQLKDISAEEAVEKLKTTLKEMKEEGAI